MYAVLSRTVPDKLRIAAQDAALHLVDRRPHAARLLGQQLAGVGRRIAAALALEQARADAALQRVEPAHHGRVLHAQLARRAGQRTGVDDGQRIAQVVPVERSVVGNVHGCKVRLPILALPVR